MLGEHIMTLEGVLRLICWTFILAIPCFGLYETYKAGEQNAQLKFQTKIEQLQKDEKADIANLKDAIDKLSQFKPVPKPTPTPTVIPKRVCKVKK